MIICGRVCGKNGRDAGDQIGQDTDLNATLEDSELDIERCNLVS